MRPYLALHNHPPKPSQYHKTQAGNGHFAEQSRGWWDRGKCGTYVMVQNFLTISFRNVWSFSKIFLQMTTISCLLSSSFAVPTQGPLSLSDPKQFSLESKLMQPTRKNSPTGSSTAALSFYSNSPQGSCSRSQMANQSLFFKSTYMKVSVTKVQYVLLQLGGEAKKFLRPAGEIRQRG